MPSVVVSVRYEAGSLSAPAFLNLEVKDEVGTLHILLLRGKRATRLKHLKAGDPFTI